MSDVIGAALRAYAAGQPVIQPGHGPAPVIQAPVIQPAAGAPNRARPATDATGEPCKHPPARRLRGLCGACGTFVG
jgi:hypothetical protein